MTSENRYEEQLSLIAIMMQMAMKDGEKSPSELRFISGVCELFGIHVEDIGPFRQATFDGGVNRTAAPEQRAGVRSGEPASRERLGEVEFERLVDADHRTEPQKLILGQFPREIRLLGALPCAL